MTTAYGSSQSSDWQAPAARNTASLRRSSASDAAPPGGAAGTAAENEALAGASTPLSSVPSVAMCRYIYDLCWILPTDRWLWIPQ